MLLEIVNPAILRKDASVRDTRIAKKKALEFEISGLASLLGRITNEIQTCGNSVDPCVLAQKEEVSYFKSLSEVELAKTVSEIAAIERSVAFTARTLGTGRSSVH